jgi:hypothetical protein
VTDDHTYPVKCQSDSCMAALENSACKQAQLQDEIAALKEELEVKKKQVISFGICAIKDNDAHVSTTNICI